MKAASKTHISYVAVSICYNKFRAGSHFYNAWKKTTSSLVSSTEEDPRLCVPD